MRDLIQDAIRGHNADYVEVRLEEGVSSHAAALLVPASSAVGWFV